MEREPGMVGQIVAGFNYVKLRVEGRTMITQDYLPSFKGTSFFSSPYQNSENTANTTSCTNIHGQ